MQTGEFTIERLKELASSAKQMPPPELITVNETGFGRLKSECNLVVCGPGEIPLIYVIVSGYSDSVPRRLPSYLRDSSLHGAAIGMTVSRERSV